MRVTSDDRVGVSWAVQPYRVSEHVQQRLEHISDRMHLTGVFRNFVAIPQAAKSFSAMRVTGSQALSRLTAVLGEQVPLG